MPELAQDSHIIDCEINKNVETSHHVHESAPSILHPPTKFLWNPRFSFSVILLTHQQPNRRVQTTLGLKTFNKEKQVQTYTHQVT